MPLAFLAVLLPALYWDQPVSTAPVLRKAGIERLYVPASRAAAWRKLGFAVTALDPARAAKAVAPAVEYHPDVASATSVPWIDANGWQFERDSAKTYLYDASPGSAALAVAEAFAYRADAAVRAAPRDLATLARMLRFLDGIGRPDLPVRANIGIIDDGSDTMGEVMNLMARHSLLFHVIPSPDPAYNLIVRFGAGGYSREDAADPYAFAMQIRHQLTDEKRLLRIYGSIVVLGRLYGNSAQARVHLLNYSKAEVRALRVRVLGEYPRGKLADFGYPGAALEDYRVADGATEFSIPVMGPYAVIDLTHGHD